MQTMKRIGVFFALLLLLGAVKPLSAQEGICDSAPPTRLTIGRWASVAPAVAQTPAGGLRMRETPRTSGAEVLVLPAGSLVRVTDGPQCNDGFQWWRLYVPETGQEGWSAEGLADVYYLTPAAAPDMTSTPLFATNTPVGGDAAPPLVTAAAPGLENADAACPGETALSYLSVGAAARTADQAYPVRLRSEPQADSLFLQAVYQDQVISVTGGPVCAEEHRWWQVQVSGRSGWTVEAANGRYLLIDPNNPPPAIAYAGGLTEVPPPPPVMTPPPDFTPVPTPRPQVPPAVVKRAAYTPDGARLVVGAGDGLRIYDAYSYQMVDTLAVGPVFDLVSISGALYAVTWTADGLNVVDALTGTVRTALLNAPYDPEWVAAAPDGEWLILGPTSDGSTAALWSLSAAAPPTDVPYWWPGWGVVRAAFSPDNRYVLLNGIVNTRSCLVDGAGCRFDVVRNDFLSAGLFGDVSWSADGTMMAGFSDRFWLWDGNALGLGFTLRSTLERQDPRQIALNMDGTRGAIIAGRLMEVWNLAEGNYYASRVVELPDAVHSLEFRPDGSVFVAAAGNSVLVYEPVNGNLIRQVE